MKISVDAGGLCSPNKFGTYIVTENILKALGMFDKTNIHTGYLYKGVTHLPVSENVKFKVLSPSVAWMSVRVSAEELINPKDVYLGLSQAIPWLSSAKIISFLHGLSFFKHKELYPDSYEALKDQVMFATTRAQKIIVSSAKVKQELGEFFGYTDATVIPFGVPFDMLDGQKSIKLASPTRLAVAPSKRAGGSVKSERPYFLFVGMNHKIKNIDFLVKAFTIFKEKPEHKDFELILVGDHQKFIDEKLGIRCTTVNRKELPGLYRNAAGYLSASLYESFNLPVLEALSQNCNVVGKSTAIIPELAEYVNVADELEGFVNAMNSITANKKDMDTEKILAKFSWEKYVSKLKSLYSA